MKFYGQLYKDKKVTLLPMSIESAELTKVAYNLAITNKLTMVNTLMEICHKVPGCDVDDVTNALCKATDRIISTKYMSAGLADAGPCHPRDLIAMSWLGSELNLSFNLFEQLKQARESQTSWLADLIVAES